MFGSLQFNDVFAVLDGVHASTLTAGTAKLTAAIDLTKHRKVLFVVDTGTLGTSGTLDFQVQGSLTSAGSYTLIPNTAITQLVVASNNTNYVLVEVSASKIADLGLGYLWLKGSLLAGTANSTSACLVFGFVDHYGQAADNNAATVVQVLTLT